MTNFFNKFFDYSNIISHKSKQEQFEGPPPDCVFQKQKDDNDYNSLREGFLFRRQVGNRVHQSINDIIHPHRINAFDKEESSTSQTSHFQSHEKEISLNSGDSFYSKEYEKELVFISLTTDGLVIGFSPENNTMYWCSRNKI